MPKSQTYAWHTKDELKYLKSIGSTQPLRTGESRLEMQMRMLENYLRIAESREIWWNPNLGMYLDREMIIHRATMMLIGLRRKLKIPESTED